MNTDTAKTIDKLKDGDVMMVLGDEAPALYMTLGEHNETEFWFEGYEEGVVKLSRDELAYEIEHENWILCICTSCGQMSHPGEC